MKKILFLLIAFSFTFRVYSQSSKEDQVYIIFQRAISKEKQKNYKGVIADYNKAIELDPKFEGSYFKRGTDKSLLQDYRGAIADFNEVIKLNPKEDVAYFFRGLAKIHLGQKDNGCLDLSKAGELGYAEAYYLIKKDCK